MPLRVADTVIDDILYGHVEVAEVHIEGVRVYRALDPPSTPSNRRLTAQSRLSVSVAWDAVKGADDYDLEWRVFGSSSTTSVNDLTVTVHTINHQSGQAIQWRVRAVNAAGNSPWSSWRTKSAMLLPPSTPTNRRLTAQSRLSVSVAWDAVKDADDYDLEWRVFGSSSTTSVNDLTVTVHTINHQSGQAIQWRVRAVNAAGNSPWSSWRTKSAMLLPPSTPTNRRLTAQSRLSVSVAWDAVKDADDYDLEWRVFGSSSTTSVNDLTVTVHTINHQSGQAIQWRVRAVNAAGNSPWSSWHIKSALPQIPSTPSNTRFTSRMQFSISVAWDAVNDADDYDLEWRVVGSSSTTSVNDLTVTVHTIRHRSWQVTQWRVRAVNAAGNSPWSSWHTNLITPLNTRELGWTRNSVSVAWNPVSDADDYDLEWRVVGSSSTTPVNDLTVVIYRINHQSGQSIQWRVRAAIPAGNSLWSSWRTKTR